MQKNVLFSIKKDNSHWKFNFFGIKFNFFSPKLSAKQFEITRNDFNKALNWTIKGKIFLYSNVDKFTTSQKIWFLTQEFYKRTGYFPNFKHPRSFNEKINWMKLNYYNPTEKNIIDKYEFKNYIKEQLGEGYTIPLIGLYEDVNDIDFDELPDRFVIKTTTNGGAQGVIVVTNKNRLKINKTKYKLNNLLQEWNSCYYTILDAGYKDIKPRIIIEEYMPIREGKALEYKMFCFHGEVKFCLIECDYFGKNPKRAFYDKDFNEMPFKIGSMPKVKVKKPETYNEMIRIAEKLSAGFPFVRVDFYDINGRVYVGEMTFTSGGGYSKFTPLEWDFRLGEYLDLKKLNPEYMHILPEFEQKNIKDLVK